MISGRICQDSSTPFIEDPLSTRCGLAKTPPDAFISEKAKRSVPAQAHYKPVKYPLSFECSSLGMDAVRERLLLVEPETDLEDALRYIKEASFALFMVRSKEGILGSNSKDLISPFEDVLSCRREDSNKTALEAITSEIRANPVEKDRVEVQAQRMKAAFNLLRALEIKHSL